ncbi:hypothetical protein B0H11DRAFT_2107138 [Mycena galericulata]|nr:hypothetical protein B0H11DRAFT_2107138 [Mycena galericulata]
MRNIFFSFLPHFILRYLGSTTASQECCYELNKQLPDQVHFPGSSEYLQQQSTYYSAEQASLTPHCRVSPRSPADVSKIVQLSASLGCKFSVRSGGHMGWVGSSNIDSEGFAVDLRQLNTVNLSQDQRTVIFGSGAKWSEVYDVLVPLNLTTVGGRASDVGVGGFLLGGGISFLSLQHGFGSDNIVRYEIVLADGSIQSASQTEKPDLFWALKMGSSNYGIVTRFEMSTFPLGEIWAGMMYFQIDEALPLLTALIGFTIELTHDPLGMMAVSMAWNPAQQDYIIWAPSMYLKPAPFPPLFSEMATISSRELASTMRITNLTGMTDEVQATAPGGGRSEWWSLTLEPNAQLPIDIQLKGREIFGPILHKEGVLFAITIQPLTAGLAAAGGKNGGNPSGMTPKDGDSFLLLGCSFWASPEDDESIKQKTRELLSWAESTARERGLLKPFIYPNYALGIQAIFKGFGQQNLEKMRRVRDVYDPRNVFGRYWRGGFKLGVERGEPLVNEL